MSGSVRLQKKQLVTKKVEHSKKYEREVKIGVEETESNSGLSYLRLQGFR